VPRIRTWPALLAMLPLVLSGCWLMGISAPAGQGVGPDIAAAAPVEGLCVEYQVPAADAGDVTADTLERTRVIIEDRVSAFGVAEPRVTAEGSDRILVTLPGLAAAGPVAEQLRSLVGAAGVLELVPVPPASIDQVAVGQPLPDALEAEPLFTGSEVAALRSGEDGSVQPVVHLELELEEAAARVLDEHAADNVGGALAIVLDGIVVSAPVLKARSVGGQVRIAGAFTADEVSALATIVRFGSLPAGIREVSLEPCPVRPGYGPGEPAG
jgi:preprotein translocase subunit SecD